MNRPKKRLGELLVEAGLIDEFQLRGALSHQQQWGGRLGKSLIELNLVSEERLVGFLAKHFRLPAIDFRRIRIAPGVLKTISVELARKHNIIPLFTGEEGGKKFLAVAMSNPADLLAIDEIEFASGRKARPVVASDLAIAAAIKYYYEQSGPPPYAPDAKPSTDMTYADLIAITREYLRPKPEAAPEQPAYSPDAEVVLEDSAHDTPGEATEDGEDSVIVFAGGAQREIQLRDGAEPANVQAPPTPRAGGAHTAPANGPTTDQVLRALINVLVEKGVITRDDIVRKLRA